jgi:hypothetical protein
MVGHHLDWRLKMGARLLTGGVLALIGLFTVKLVLGLIKGVGALLGFLLFTVLPILLIGWIVVRLFRAANGSAAAD